MLYAVCNFGVYNMLRCLHVLRLYYILYSVYPFKTLHDEQYIITNFEILLNNPSLYILLPVQ